MKIQLLFLGLKKKGGDAGYNLVTALNVIHY